ncbi:MAG: hypothetical protein GXO14_00680, partial [Thermococci archaeon]|nr:hypothetical protein [Thermococci archaeon]
IHSTKIVNSTVGRSSPVLPPTHVSFRDMSNVFEGNIFVKEAKKYWGNNDFYVLVPTGVFIKRRIINDNTNIAGIEISLRGGLLTPLKFLSITATVVRIQFGVPKSLSHLVECPLNTDKLIDWMEINCVGAIRYKMRGWLFFHPKFHDWYQWARDLVLHARTYLDFDMYVYLKQRDLGKH